MRRLVVLAAALLLAGAAEKRSGYNDASGPVQAMQDDDGANPAMLWVQQGEALWRQAAPSGPACASCHGEPAAMRGVAARYPMFDPGLGRPITLVQRINQCRTQRQSQPALSPDSEPMLGLSAMVGLQSRGLPLAIDAAGPAQAVLDEGRAWFTQPLGQLNMSCAQCHEVLAGQRLGGSRIPQGHVNAYPEYRIEWQGVGSLERRIRNCLTGVRAEPFDPAFPGLAALQFYLGWRSNGLPVETPGVRP